MVIYKIRFLEKRDLGYFSIYTAKLCCMILPYYYNVDFAIQYLEKEKAARKEERTEQQKQFGGFPTREQMSELKKK